MPSSMDRREGKKMRMKKQEMPPTRVNRMSSCFRRRNAGCVRG